MKYILPFIVAFILVSCKTTDILTYNYKSTTMLGTRTVNISQDSVVYTYFGRAESTRTARSTSPQEWIELKASMKNVKLDEIADLKAPSNRRATDASPFGSIQLTTKDSTYNSASFDGYMPNKMLVPLMTVIEKIANTNN